LSNTKLEDHPLSAVHNCLFNLFAATINIGGRSSIRNLRTCHAVVTGTRYMDGNNPNESKFYQGKIKSRLKSGNSCKHVMPNLLFFSLLSKNLKIKIYRSIIFTVVLYGCETWSLLLEEERRLRVYENRMLRRILGLRGTK